VTRSDLDSPGQPKTMVDLRKLDTEGVDDGFIDVVVYP
jgi:hypothetical protein